MQNKEPNMNDINLLTKRELLNEDAIDFVSWILLVCLGGGIAFLVNSVVHFIGNGNIDANSSVSSLVLLGLFLSCFIWSRSYRKKVTDIYRRHNEIIREKERYTELNLQGMLSGVVGKKIVDIQPPKYMLLDAEKKYSNEIDLCLGGIIQSISTLNANEEGINLLQLDVINKSGHFLSLVIYDVYTITVEGK